MDGGDKGRKVGICVAVTIGLELAKSQKSHSIDHLILVRQVIITSTTLEMKEAIELLIKKNPIMIFSKTYCPYHNYALTWLQSC